MPTSNSLPLLTIVSALLPLILSSGVPLVVSPGLNISTQPNVPAHLPSCTNLTAAPTIPCYTKLNTTAYLENYNLTIREVCAPQEYWSTCLLRSVYQIAGANCTHVGPGTQSCVPFDCANLNSTTCMQPMTTNRTDVTTPEAQGWYAAWNVYSVHHHIVAWASAINTPSSESAILAAINPRIGNTAASVLKTLLSQYGLNPSADNAIAQLLDAPTAQPQQVYGNTRVRGESSTLSGTQWRQVLVERLGEALVLANDDFGDWLTMASGGAFSTRGLSGAPALRARLKKVK